MSTARDSAQILAAAGKYGDALEHVRTAAAAAGRRYAEIASDKGLSEAGRNHHLAKAYLQARQSVEDHLGREASRARATDRTDASNILGTGGLKGDPATLIVSRRDAQERVEQIENQSDLQALLKSATRTGDEVLARAVAERALRDQDAKTMELFANDRPDMGDAVERLWNAERAESIGLQFVTEMSGLFPGPLSNATESAIEEMAANDPSAAEDEAARNAPRPLHASGGPPAFQLPDHMLNPTAEW